MMCCSTLSHCLPFWCAIKLPNLMPVYSEWRRATRTRILHPLGFWTLVIPHPLNPFCAKTRLRCARHCPSSYCVATLFFYHLRPILDGLHPSGWEQIGTRFEAPCAGESLWYLWSCEGGAGYALWIMCDDKVTTVSSIKPRNMGIGQNIKLQYLSIFGEVHIH